MNNENPGESNEDFEKQEIRHFREKADENFSLDDVPEEKTIETLNSILEAIRGPKIKAKKNRTRNLLLFFTLFLFTAFFALQLNPGVQDWLINLNKKTVFGTPGTTMELILDDGTLVKLSKRSSLTFAHNFNQLNKKNVDLIGDGYFSISRNDEKPFYVHIGPATIETNGATFGVNEADSDDAIALFLIKGEARITHPAQLPPLELLAGEGAVLGSKKRAIITDGKLDNYLSWWTGKLEFSRLPLWVVASQLSIIYDTVIEFDNDDIKAYPYSGTLKKEDLNKVLKIITKSLGLDFRIESPDYRITIFEPSKD